MVGFSIESLKLKENWLFEIIGTTDWETHPFRLSSAKVEYYCKHFKKYQDGDQLISYDYNGGILAKRSGIFLVRNDIIIEDQIEIIS